MNSNYFKDLVGVSWNITPTQSHLPLILADYISTMNDIDDFFEYRNQSVSDRLFVQRQMSILTGKLSKYAKVKKL